MVGWWGWENSGSMPGVGADAGWPAEVVQASSHSRNPGWGICDLQADAAMNVAGVAASLGGWCFSEGFGLAGAVE